VLLYLVILAVVFSVLAPSFMSGGTLSAVLDLTSPLLVVGGAMTMCLIAAEVDLSVAGVVGLSSTLTALLLLKGQPWPIAVVAAVVVGGVVGVINGVLTARLVGLIPLFPSFLPTLAMQWVCIGVAGALEPSQQSITISDPAFAALFGGLLPLAYAISIEMSERKAYTAAALDMKTTDMTPLAASGEALHTLASVAGGRYTVLGGGLPLRIDGTFLGGVASAGEPRSRIRRSSRKLSSVSIGPSRRPGDTDVPQDHDPAGRLYDACHVPEPLADADVVKYLDHHRCASKLRAAGSDESRRDQNL
jgi:Haem-degrading/Branched-chain amino acid transport system / permease component